MKASGYTLLFFLVVAPLITFSQDFDEKLAEYRAKKFIQDFSIVAGPSINFLRGSNATDDGPGVERQFLVGYSLGAQLGTKNLVDKFSLTTGLFYERKGGKSLLDAQYWDSQQQALRLGEIIYSYKYDYYTMNLRIQYTFGKSSRLKLGGGGYISYLDKQVLEIDRSGTSGSMSTENQTKFNTKTDLGISAHIGYRVLELKPFKIELLLLNNLGLKNTRPGLNEGFTQKTNSTVLLLELIF